MDNNKCIVCNCVIPDARIEFLVENNKEMTCLKHSITKPIKAIYSGEHGTSDLIFCDRVYNDSVRSKFYNAEVIGELEEDGDMEDKVPTEE